VRGNEEVLRRLTLQDEGVLRSSLGISWRGVGDGLDPRTLALARIGALSAMGGSFVSYLCAVEEAGAAGLTLDDVAAALVAAAPLIGTVRAASAAVELALALGYEVKGSPS
jgi:4-carboxymuconolactone decarboxylase